MKMQSADDRDVSRVALAEACVTALDSNVLDEACVTALDSNVLDDVDEDN